MNFTVGCKEKRGEEWIYYLMDGTALSQEEWSEVIRQHIVENHHENVFKKIKGTVLLVLHQSKMYLLTTLRISNGTFLQ